MRLDMKTLLALRRRAAGLVSLAFAAGLAGCSLAPVYQRPEVPVAAVYPSGATQAAEVAFPAGETAAADIGWRDFFRDPLLQQLIAIALDNNRDLRKAALNVEAAQALYRIRRADMLPNLGAVASSAVERVPADLSTAGVTRINRRHEAAGVASAWELDLWGRIRSLSDRALASYLALAETRIATQMTLVAEVANAYLSLCADQALLHLTADTLETQRRSYELTVQREGAGAATRLDLRRAEITLRNAEAQHAVYTRQTALDRNALVLLLGQPLTRELAAQLDAAATLPDDVVPATIPSGLPSDLLARRPDIRAAEQTLLGANADIGAARAAFFPTISLTGSAGTASADLDNLFNAGSGVWSFLPRITLPLFRGGALRVNLDLAHVQKRIEVANYEHAIQTAFREVADGLARKGTLDAQIQSEELSVQAGLSAYELAEQRYQEGMDDYLALLDAHRTLYGAQQALVRTRLARLTNRVDLYKALGGGWSEHGIRTQARNSCLKSESLASNGAGHVLCHADPGRSSSRPFQDARSGSLLSERVLGIAQGALVQ